MSPYQHGEVYVLDDGAETDLDLGHYERFTDAPLTRDCNYTDRQDLPVGHRRRSATASTWARPSRSSRTSPTRSSGASAAWRSTTSTSSSPRSAAPSATSRGLPFLEAIRQFALDVGSENACYIHLTLVPLPEGRRRAEDQADPALRRRAAQIGIQPDIARLPHRRADLLGPEAQDLLALQRARRGRHRSAPTRTASTTSRWSIHDEGLDDVVCDILRLGDAEPDLGEWNDLVKRVADATVPVRIGIVGKYVSLPDAYLSVVESLEPRRHPPRCGRLRSTGSRPRTSRACSPRGA